jgi:DNA-directed RNA polymerase subunit F
MEVISTNNSILCNSEVFKLLQEKRTQRPGIGSNLELQSRENIEIKLLKYFEEYASRDLNMETVGLFINELTQANISFTKAEYMVLLNHLPQSAVEIYLIIEECAERLTDDQVQLIIDCIQKYFLS